METVNPDDYSDGGILRHGWTTNTNRTGKPERVLTREQSRRLAEGGTP